MSWSHSLVAQNLTEGKDDLIQIENHTQKNKKSVLFDYNEYFLFDEDNSPYLIIGEDLKFNLGDYLEISGNLAQVMSYDYEDAQYQVLNLQLTAKFKLGDRTIERSTGSKFTIEEVSTHAYKIKDEDGKEGFIPLHMQTLLNFIP